MSHSCGLISSLIALTESNSLSNDGSVGEGEGGVDADAGHTVELGAKTATHLPRALATTVQHRGSLKHNHNTSKNWTVFTCYPSNDSRGALDTSDRCTRGCHEFIFCLSLFWIMF